MSEHSSSSGDAAGSPTTPPSNVSPAPTAPAATLPLHRDVYLAADGTRCIGRPNRKEKSLAPLILYLNKVDMGEGKTLEGGKEHGRSVLRFELQVESRRIRVGYVETAVKGEVRRSKEMKVELQLTSHDLRSAKVDIQRLTDRGGSSVEVILQAANEETDLRTLIFTVDTRESLFDSYSLERIKSALKEWATRDHFPTAITLIRALPIPSAGSGFAHLPPPASFDPNEPTTWFAPFVPRKEKEKNKRVRKPEAESEQDDDADWVDDSAAARPVRHNSSADVEEYGTANFSPSSRRRATRKSIPSHSMKELSVEEQEEADEVAMLAGPSRGTAYTAADRDTDAYQPSPKKAKKQQAINDTEKDAAPPRKGTKADLVNQLDTFSAQIRSLSQRLEESEQKVARLEETAADVPALTQAVATLPNLMARLDNMEAELGRSRPDSGKAEEMDEA